VAAMVTKVFSIVRELNPVKANMNSKILVSIFYSLILISLASVSCVSSNFTPPEYRDISTDELIEANINEVYQAYIDDESAANDKYKGKRLLFSNVTVDLVKSYFLNAREGDVCIVVGGLKFKPRYNSEVDSVFPDFKIDIAGKCQGMILGQVYITDCWFKVTEGDTSGFTPDVY
jgi:hypothetical protein